MKKNDENIFSVIRSFFHFLKMLCVLLILFFLLYWIQNLTNSTWGWMGFIASFFDYLLAIGNNICSLSFDIFDAVLEMKYVCGLIILIGFVYFIHLLSIITTASENTYKSVNKMTKKTEELIMNKELQKKIAMEEKRINKYVVIIQTRIKPSLAKNKNIAIDINEQNELMNKYIEEKLGVHPEPYENGFMYSFDDFSKIDMTLYILFKVIDSKAPLNYAICVQSGNLVGAAILQLKKMMNLEYYGKIIMAADTLFRYKYNSIQRYETSQLGVFQAEDKTIEVHEFCKE